MSRFAVHGAATPLGGAVTVPGDKSIGHRAVMFAAIGDGPCDISGLSGGEDNRSTVAALRALGVAMRDDGPGRLHVDGVGWRGLRAAAADLDCGNSGTTMRLLCGLLAGRAFTSRLDGDASLRRRPMRRVAEPLTRMGGRVVGERAPLVVGGVSAPLHGIDHVSEVASAQVKSALLIAALGAEGPSSVVEPAQSRDHSERMLRAMGAPLDAGAVAGGWRVRLDPRGWDGRLHAPSLAVPGDLSSAAFLLAAALLRPGSSIEIRDVGVNPTRAGILDALRLMGADIEVRDARDVAGEPVATLVARASPLHGIAITGELSLRCIDELPLLAAVAAHADGVTTIADARELRVKESDRVASTCRLLRAFGVEAEERDDGLMLEGRPGALHPGEVWSDADHRIAMSAAVCALAIPGASTMHDTDNVATSFPSFVATLQTLGADLRLER